MRAILKLAVALFTVASTGTAMAQTVAFPSPDVPNYFSGTNARAEYGVITAGYNNCWIDEFELYIGGELVIAKSRPRPNVPPAIRRDTEAGIVMFDSNHFANGTSVEVKCRALVNGSWHESSYTAPARNRAICFGMNDIDVTGYTDQGYFFGPEESAEGAANLLWLAGWDVVDRADLWDFGHFE